MIVTTGRHIRIDACSSSLFLDRTAETPGCVTVRDKHNGSIRLPANKIESEEFIAAYRRTISEDIEYRKSDCEFAKKCPRCGSVDCAQEDEIDVEPML